MAVFLLFLNQLFKKNHNLWAGFVKMPALSEATLPAEELPSHTKPKGKSIHQTSFAVTQEYIKPYAQDGSRLCVCGGGTSILLECHNPEVVHI